jgi:hypothetical protein
VADGLGEAVGVAGIVGVGVGRGVAIARVGVGTAAAGPHAVARRNATMTRWRRGITSQYGRLAADLLTLGP